VFWRTPAVPVAVGSTDADRRVAATTRWRQRPPEPETRSCLMQGKRGTRRHYRLLSAFLFLLLCRNRI